MRRIALIVATLAAAGSALAATAGADDTHTYKIEMYNAFGIVENSDVRVTGVNSGVVKELEITEDKRALVTVELTGPLAVLGEDTTCASEPQSLIAEYFIDCKPAGPPLEEGGTIPASRVSQTVQADIVANTMREPFKRRLQLLINEFGTALAGNAEKLNEAIRLGAPALTELREATKILADHNRIIRDLNANSDTVIGELTENREDVVRFIQEARDVGRASSERRADVSRSFEILDDFLAELQPMLAELENVADEQTPLLRDLRVAAPGLSRLATNLPPFNAASERSLSSLGDAAVVGRRALRRGRDEIRQLAEAGRRAPATAEILADFLRDIDDPRRAVEIDDRVPRDTGRTNPQAGRRNTKGYTGLEGLLNYAYYQAVSLNQFDRIGHLLNFTLYEVNSGPCGHFSTGRDPETGEPGVPKEGGGTTTNILEADNCVGWLGPNQPGLNTLLDGELPQYHPSVCPNGTEPAEAEAVLCDQNPNTTSAPAKTKRDGARAGRSGSASGEEPGASVLGSSSPSAAPTPPRLAPDDVLDQILDGPKPTLDGVREGVRRKSGRKRSGGGKLEGAASGTARATEDLLDFLFAN